MRSSVARRPNSASIAETAIGLFGSAAFLTISMDDCAGPSGQARTKLLSLRPAIHVQFANRHAAPTTMKRNTRRQ